MDAYLKWFYETVVILHELLHETGSIYVHLDWHVVHYAKPILDEIFGREAFCNEIVWWYTNKLPTGGDLFDRQHDSLLWYAKGQSHTFHELPLPIPKEKQQFQARTRKVRGKREYIRDAQGEIVYELRDEKLVPDVWEIPLVHPIGNERVGYPTQKPEALLGRIIQASSNPGDFVLDCFVGSGTAAAVAERSDRRWIACDLGRFAVHTTRKRLLSISNVRSFVVQNLGKYERQLWANAEFGEGNGEQAAKRQRAYVEFILKLSNATPIHGYTWLHGVKPGRMVHVGAVDAPVSAGDVTRIAAEFKRAIGTGKDAPRTNSIDVLGWDFAFELNEVAKQQAAAANIQMHFLRIPRDVMDKRAVEQGDVRFFELAALSVEVKIKKGTVSLKLKDFIIPPDDVPEEARKAVKHWSQWIDYWAVDWDNKNDTFHNEWQTYRTRQERSLKLEVTNTYAEPGEYKIVVKVIDILGNDTTKSMRIKVA